MSQKPKIAVVGAGAIGNLLAAIWARAGEDVTLVVRPERVALLRAAGLRASGIIGEFHVAPKVEAEVPAGAGFAIFTMKTQDLAEAIRAQSSSLGTATVVAVQNGVRAREIILGERGVEPISAILLLNSSTLEPGTVRYNRAGVTVLGAADAGERYVVTELKRLFELVAPVFVTGEIEGAMWSKLIINSLTNSINALTGKPLNECVRDPMIAEFAVAQLKESFGVVRAAGIPLINMPGAPMKLFSRALALPSFVGKMILRKNLGKAEQETIMTSTLQSLLRKRPTEIDYLNGEFVRLGEKIGFPTPINRATVEGIKRIERTGEFLTRDEIGAMVPK
ncbi:MAG: 2-dehydropantoate 2-reductase [Xanthobacteraceae bacterium]|nr:2-dehydropantoate 2-reductase [Xanthobacteraceae bacterium]